MRTREKIAMTFCMAVCFVLLFSTSIGAKQGSTTEKVDNTMVPQGEYCDALMKLCDPNGGLIGVSSHGDRTAYPENSLEAVEAAARTGIDIVLVDVSKTADGVIVLFGDETTDRMFENESKRISEMNYSELYSLCLLNSRGGKNSQKTQCRVPTLGAAVLSAVENDFALLLNVPEMLLADVGEKLNELDACYCVAVMTSAKADCVSAAFDGLEKKPLVIGVKKGNVVFDVNGYINDFKEISAVGVNLKTTNRYGVNFQKCVLKNFNGSLRAVADPSQPVTCGAREDCEKWWDDLISRGYSVIVTDYPQLFVDYVERCDAARGRLEEAFLSLVENGTLPQFKNSTLNDYKKAYDDAVTAARTLLDDASASYRDLTDANAGLIRAVTEINLHFEELEQGQEGKTVTAPRILLCVAAVVVVVAVQIYFYKKRKDVK